MPPKKKKTPQEDGKTSSLAERADEEARQREKETRKRILAVAREQKIKAEAEKAQLPVGILQAVGGLPPSDSEEESEEEEEEEEVEVPMLAITRPPSPASSCSSPETSPEPTSFCSVVPATMLLVGGMVMLSG